MGQVLYRQYRPKSLDQVVGQEHITTSLKHALKSGKISHAYLFTGPRGVGKTSVARILAYAVNNFDYDEKTQLDIIEIDAASNRRIDEVRDLRDKVNIAPTNAKYKVYIIDEVHMLTREAFNALLKTLEEPPDHVIFILATTEAYKLPETIISRTQRYSFKPVSVEKMIKHLAGIAKKEKINVDDDALELIAEHGEGSFRDSISLLDQLRNSDLRVTKKAVEEALGIAPVNAVKILLTNVMAHDAVGLVKTLSDLYSQGYQPMTLSKQLGEQIRESLLSGASGLSDHETLNLLKRLLDVPGSSYPDKLLEIVLLESSFEKVPIVNKNEMGKIIKMAPVDEPVTSSEENRKIKDVKPDINKSVKHNNIAFDEKIWNELLQTVKQKHNTLYSVLRMARPEFTNNSLTLTLGFKFHQKRLDEPKNKQSIADTIYNLTGKNIEIICLFVAGTTPYEINTDDSYVIEDLDGSSDPSLEAINNIFGSSEVLES